MSFRSASENVLREREGRKGILGRVLKFGISFLDDALRGIFPDDLVLLGAPSGVGKTQACVNIAITNLDAGKRVHFIALEASEFEIERRLKYQQVAKFYFADDKRPRLERSFNFTSWMLGEYEGKLDQYEEMAERYCSTYFTDLFTFYKSEKFDVTDLVENVAYAADQTDLIIIDHVHYFDWDSDNDNRAIKEIAKTVRSLALDYQKPIVLVAHLRKRDRNNKELVAGLDEFHGSSDLTKIATKVVTVAPGPVTEDKKFTTYFRIPKNRIDGGPTRYMGAMTFDPKKGGYDDEYGVGWAHSEKFTHIEPSQMPQWARSFGNGGFYNSFSPRESSAFENFKRSAITPRVYNPSERD